MMINVKLLCMPECKIRNQKDDLQNRVKFLRQFCHVKGMPVEDYGSGLNDNRKKWNE